MPVLLVLRNLEYFQVNGFRVSIGTSTGEGGEFVQLQSFTDKGAMRYFCITLSTPSREPVRASCMFAVQSVSEHRTQR